MVQIFSIKKKQVLLVRCFFWLTKMKFNEYKIHALKLSQDNIVFSTLSCETKGGY